MWVFVLDDFWFFLYCVFGFSAQVDQTVLVDLYFEHILREEVLLAVLVLHLFLDLPLLLDSAVFGNSLWATSFFSLRVTKFLLIPTPQAQSSLHFLRSFVLMLSEMFFYWRHSSSSGVGNIFRLLVVPIDFDIDRRGQLAVASHLPSLFLLRCLIVP